MRRHISFFLAAVLLFMSHAVFASPSNNDDDGDVVAAHSAPAHAHAHAVQGPQSQAGATTGHKKPAEDAVDAPAPKRSKEDNLQQEEPEYVHKTWFQTLYQPVGLASLHLNVQLEILRYLDPKSQNHLLRTCRYYRAFAQPVDGQDHANVPHNLRIDLLMTSIAKQSADLELFMRDQRSTFRAQRSDDREQARRNQVQRIKQLRAEIKERYYEGTLSPNTKHGQTYRGIGPGSIDRNGWLDLFGKGLRLVPLNFQGVERVRVLYLDNNQLQTSPVLTGLTALGELHLDNNQLPTPPVLTGLTALRGLYLDNNQLQTPPVLTGLPALRELGLSDNQLQTSPVLTGLTALGVLYLDHNQLQTPPVLTGLTALGVLGLSNNQLQTPPVLTGLTALRVLYLDKGLYEDPTLLNTLRELNEGRQPGNKIILYSIIKNANGKTIITGVTLD